MTRTTNGLRVAMATLFAITVGATSAFAAACPTPDTFGHTCTDNPAACVANPAPTCFGNLLGDDNCTARAVGFSFQHYGVTQTTVGVASNGFVQMGGCGAGSSDFTNDCPIPNALTPNNAIFGVWDDLNVQAVASRVCEGLSGVAPDRTYTVDFNNVPYFSGGGTANFQIQIGENGGPPAEAVVRVRQSAVGQPTGYTQGIENAAGTDGLTRYCNNGITGLFCIEWKKATAPPVGTCDLTPIEAKLDIIGPKITAIQTTVNTINTNVDVKVSSRASQASVDALETKSDALSLDLQVAEAKLDTMPCDIFNLLVGILIDPKKIPSTHPCYVAPAR